MWADRDTFEAESDGRLAVKQIRRLHLCCAGRVVTNAGWLVRDQGAL